MTASFRAMGDERFVSLTTFRKSGEPVSTPVWIAHDGDALVVTTPAETGKVKRIRSSGRVELRPCNRRGKVPDGAVAVAAQAAIVTGDAAERATEKIKRKYGFEYRILKVLEPLFSRGRKERVILAITSG